MSENMNYLLHAYLSRFVLVLLQARIQIQTYIQFVHKAWSWDKNEFILRKYTGEYKYLRDIIKFELSSDFCDQHDLNYIKFNIF